MARLSLPWSNGGWTERPGQDAICWLLDLRVDPADITWIRPRDTWLLNRADFQPAELRTLEGVVLQLEEMAASESVDQVYERLEEHGIMLRTDRSVVPTMMKGATSDESELVQLARIDAFVRLGHIRRIDPEQIVLDQGVVPTTRDHVHVHCAASGPSDNPPRAIFTSDTITLQLVTRVGLTLSGALLGILESTGRSAEEKTHCARRRRCPTRHSTTSERCRTAFEPSSGGGTPRTCGHGWRGHA